MIINHNLNAMNAHRQLGFNTVNAGKSMEKLSSGLRINRAGDDAAGLAISEKMRAQIKGLEQASRNAQDGISMIQTAEGALNETHSILQRMRELATQSANGTNTDTDRQAIQNEITQLKSEIDRIGNTTEFNTQKLLNGSLRSSGTSTSQNSTVGSVIGKLGAASATANAAMGSASSVAVADTDFAAETINIDGTEITVNWQNLSTEQMGIIKAGTASGSSDDAKKAAANLIIDTINNAIDQAGKGIAHITGYLDGSNNLVLQSGSEGTSSKISIKASDTGNILEKAMALTSSETLEQTGTNNYNGSSISVNTKFNFNIGEIIFQGTLTSAISNGTAMTTAASSLQTAINNAINAYNTNVLGGSTHENAIKNVKVNATEDGRLEIISESGPISFSDLSGNTVVKDLGLTQAQTSSAGNGGMTFQIGSNNGQTLTFGINDMRTAALGISGVDVTTAAGAQNAITTLDAAITKVSSERAKLGAIQNRLEHTINNLGTSSENLTAAESRIRDVDMAKEMMTFSKNNILAQAAQAMLAQANQQPQGVLQLLR